MIRFIPLIILSLAFLTGCQLPLANKSAMGETAFQPAENIKVSSQNRQLTISLAVNDVYCKETACSCIHDIAARQYGALQKQLKDQFNIDLKLTYFPEIYIMEKEMVAKKFDGVICKPWDAILKTLKHDLKYKRIVDILDPNENQWLSGVIMVKKESPVKKLSDLNGKRVVAGPYSSYEKYHAPVAMLGRKEIKPGKWIYKESCLESISALLDEDADVAIVSNYVMSASCAVDLAAPEDFRIIGRTENMPLTSVILDLNKVNQADALRLQKALLTLSGKNSPEEMMSKGFVKPAKWSPCPLPPAKKAIN